MSGYTPVFGTLFQGSLCGQWPALPVFCTLLPLADRNGEIDLSFSYLAATTGWPEDLLRQGIAQLERPDPNSRSPDDDGRRLVRLRENTEWGWRVVNHGKYREKARLAAKAALEVATGKNKSRMQDRRRPPVTAADPLSNPNTNSNANVDGETSTSAEPTWLDQLRAIYPKRAGGQNWRSAERAANARLREGHTKFDLLDGARRYAAFVRATGREGTEYVKQAATFLGPDKHFLEPWTPPPTKAEARFLTNVETARKWAEG